MTDRLFTFLPALLILCGCGHGQINSDQSNKPAPLQTYKIDSSQKLSVTTFQKEFEEFLIKSAGQSPLIKLGLWNSIVEAPHQEFYDVFVWSIGSSRSKEKKTKSLLEMFEFYKHSAAKIISNFETFENTVETQVRNFRLKFPKAKFDSAIIGALSPTFNGKSAALPNSHDPVLIFGVDMLTKRNDNLNILFSHELFHLYHAETAGITNDGNMPGHSIVLPLWAEGLATFASHELNPTAPPSDVLMDTELAKISTEKIPILARNFLAVSHETIQAKGEGDRDGDGGSENYRKWFTKGASFSAFFPSRCAYLLGYYVVQHLRKSYSLDEMAQWNSLKAEIQVERSLTEMTKQ